MKKKQRYPGKRQQASGDGHERSADRRGDGEVIFSSAFSIFVSGVLQPLFVLTFPTIAQTQHSRSQEKHEDPPNLLGRQKKHPIAFINRI